VALVGVAARAEDGPAAGTYPLKPVTMDKKDGNPFQFGYQFARLGKDGKGEIAFATKSGKLRFSFADGKILIDRNDDGAFDANDGEGVKVGGGEPQSFEVPVTLAGQAFQYPAMIMAYVDDKQKQPEMIYITSRARLKADIGGTAVFLQDGNCNGKFTDASAENGRADSVQIGEKGKTRPLAKFMDVQGKLFAFEVTGEGEAVKLTPYTGPVGTAKVAAGDGWQVCAVLVGAETGLMVEATGDKAAQLIPGKYRIAGVMAGQGVKGGDFQSTRQADTMFYGQGGKAELLELKEGENALTYGPPFKLEAVVIKSQQKAGEYTVKDVFLVGAGGEKYRADNNGSAKATLAACVRSGGQEKEVFKLSYG
jgi:hypothetical protein